MIRDMDQIAKYFGIGQNTYSQYEVGAMIYPVDAVIKLPIFTVSVPIISLAEQP